MISTFLAHCHQLAINSRVQQIEKCQITRQGTLNSPRRRPGNGEVKVVPHAGGRRDCKASVGRGVG